MGRDRWRWLLGLPGLAMYSTIVLIPIALTLQYSLTVWDGINDPVWAGVANYLRAFESGDMMRAARVSVVLSLVLTIGLNLLGLYFAHLLYRHGRSNLIFRAIFFFPVVLSPVLVGFLWRRILARSGGIVNEMLAPLMNSPIAFLGDPTLALWSLVGVTLWHILGFTVVIYIAALQTIRLDLLEAAVLEGAVGWQLFRRVTFPLIAPAFTVNTIVILTLGAREYDRILSLTGGGPARTTESITFLIVEEGFGRLRLGYSSAIAIYVLAVVAIFAGLLLRKLRHREVDVA